MRVKYAGRMGIALPLAEMTVEEKLDVMERIWDDLTSKGNDWAPPDWHAVVLALRQKGIDDGTDELIDLDTAWADLTAKRKV